jgi:hypothetical protein
VVSRRLRPVTAANYDSPTAPTGCLEGTRVEILTKLDDWVNDGAPGLTTLWLNGMAGTGKTAIASTFARTMEDQGILGATFFIDRQQSARRDLRRIVQTLAYDLAKHDSERLKGLLIALDSDSTLESLPYQQQVRLLIRRPFDRVGSPKTMVIVVDGLNESGALEGASLLETLVTSLAYYPIKLFVTSRNEADIADAFRGFAHNSIRLQEMDVSGDARLYWEHNLDGLCRRRLLPDWRSTVSIDLLVDITGNLFIYAIVVLGIIQNTRTSPIKKLSELLEKSCGGSGYAMTFDNPVKRSSLEMLYIHILSEAMKDDEGNVRDEYARHLHGVLEVVIFAREPITPQALSDLLDMDIDNLHAYLAPLSSVLIIPDDASPDGVVLPLHQSFLDFVRQQGNIVHPRLGMHIALAHKSIVEHCLFQLNKHLRFDICDIKDASLSNSEVLDLLDRLRQRVSAALRYSCRHWLTHWLEYLRAVGSEARAPHDLSLFCTEHLLHWIEVLSLTGDINGVQRVMSQLMYLMNVRSSHS